MKEKNIQTEFKNKNQHFGVFELKLVKGKSLPFSRVPEHQEVALENSVNGIGTYWKIPDIGWAQKPYDCLFLGDVHAYLVVCFYEPRKKKKVYYIPIMDWLHFKSETNKKSANEADCEEMAIYEYDWI